MEFCEAVKRGRGSVLGFGVQLRLGVTVRTETAPRARGGLPLAYYLLPDR